MTCRRKIRLATATRWDLHAAPANGNGLPIVRKCRCGCDISQARKLRTLLPTSVLLATSAPQFGAMLNPNLTHGLLTSRTFALAAEVANEMSCAVLSQTTSRVWHAERLLLRIDSWRLTPKPNPARRMCGPPITAPRSAPRSSKSAQTRLRVESHRHACFACSRSVACGVMVGSRCSCPWRSRACKAAKEKPQAQHTLVHTSAPAHIGQDRALMWRQRSLWSRDGRPLMRDTQPA